MKRRPFLKLSSGLAGGAAMGMVSSSVWGAGDGIVDRVHGVPYRMLGRTGEKVSIIGYSSLALIHGEQDACNQSVQSAIERGVNYLDTAPAYGNGDAEIKLGKALVGVDRSKYLLACKTKMRTKDGAREELERSLERLKTDHFDVYQMHHLRTTDEVKEAFGPNGAMETFFKAKEEGKVRFLGFSAHTTKSALLAMENYNFDTVMFPINFIENYAFGFGDEVMDKADEIGAAVLAIKPMCGGNWPEGVERTRKWWYRPIEDQDKVNMAVRYTLSQPGVVIGFPPGFLDLFEKALIAAKTYQPVSDDELTALKEIASSSLSVFEERQKQYSVANPELDGIFQCPYASA
ncbi:MAG: aldo/keto reductase [Candidatus Hinthialibacter antarcticus]|nr:aldo/keto reductase [Candidatus Hinthialibacter antarcticus]